ncbi:rCG63410 [Rattus norvegicus]|uniref:RCG63410 n=1 Tax=Rattus norvegicus TaxID=10116 RepID=A6IMW6_RAT|nr:rCG63410 [Rattus norvegicus]
MHTDAWWLSPQGRIFEAEFRVRSSLHPLRERIAHHTTARNNHVVQSREKGKMVAGFQEMCSDTAYHGLRIATKCEGDYGSLVTLSHEQSLLNLVTRDWCNCVLAVKDCQDVHLSVPSCLNVRVCGRGDVPLHVCMQVSIQMRVEVRGQFRGHPEKHHPSPLRTLLCWSWSSPLAGKIPRDSFIFPSLVITGTQHGALRFLWVLEIKLGPLWLQGQLTDLTVIP